MKRREFIGLSALLGLATAAKAKAAFTPTPVEIEGPFYPLVAQADTDFDLTHIQGHKHKATGQAVIIKGRVINSSGEPIKNASIDLWQANSAGRYRHPSDTSGAPLDEHFQGWAIVASGHKGGFTFKTIIPGTYSVDTDWVRPPHIHFKVSKRGYQEVITQMYFPNEPLNNKDHLLMRKTPSERALMTAKAITTEPDIVLAYDIVLKSI